MTSSDLQSDLPLKKVLKNDVFVEKHFEKKFRRKSCNEQKCSEFQAGSFGQDENFAKFQIREILIKNPRKMAKIDLFCKAAESTVFYFFHFFLL